MSLISKKTKTILFGVGAFALAATATTTLAAWVVGQDTKGKLEDGTVQVSGVTTQGCTIAITSQAADHKLVIGPEKGDKSGFIQTDGKAEDEEKLSITVAGTVTRNDTSNNEDMNLIATLTWTNKNFETLVSKSYFVTPTVQFSLTATGFSGGVGHFSESLKILKWGTAFANTNPGIALDTDGIKNNTNNDGPHTVESVKAILEEITTAVNGAQFSIEIAPAAV